MERRSASEVVCVVGSNILTDYCTTMHSSTFVTSELKYVFSIYVSFDISRLELE